MGCLQHIAVRYFFVGQLTRLSHASRSKNLGKADTSGNSPNHLDTSQTIPKLTRSSGNFPNSPDYPKTSQTMGNFPNHLATFPTVQNFSLQSDNFQDYPKKSQTIPKLSRSSGNFPNSPKTFPTIQIYLLYLSVVIKIITKSVNEFKEKVYTQKLRIVF